MPDHPTVREALNGDAFTCPNCAEDLALSVPIDPALIDACTIDCTTCPWDRTYDSDEFDTVIGEEPARTISFGELSDRTQQ